MMRNKCLILLAAFLIIAGCGSTETVDDRTAIESIADDIQAAAETGDMMKIDKHLALQAKTDGYDANRMLMELSYPDALKPMFKSRTVRVMGDSAWLEFAVYPHTMTYNDLLERSRVRLMRSGGWKIVTYDIRKNRPAARPETVDTTGVDTMEAN